MGSFKCILNVDVTTLLESGCVFSARNGRKYINLEVTQRREPDQYQQDLCVAIERSREARLRGEARTFVGAGQSYIFENNRLVEKGGKVIENLEVIK